MSVQTSKKSSIAKSFGAVAIAAGAAFAVPAALAPSPAIAQAQQTVQKTSFDQAKRVYVEVLIRIHQLSYRNPKAARLVMTETKKALRADKTLDAKTRKDLLELLDYGILEFDAVPGPYDTDKYRGMFNNLAMAFNYYFPSAPNAGDALIKAMGKAIKTLDPHSRYHGPSEVRQVGASMSGNFVGVGIQIQKDGQKIKIVSPIDGGPAQKAGIKAGDLITHINGRSIANMKLQDAIKLMRGKVGTDVTFTIERPGQAQPFDVKITRAVIISSPVNARLIKEGNKTIAYIHLESFTGNSSQKIKEAIAKLQKQAGTTKISGYILDLRFNPGGRLDQAIEIVDIFLPKGARIVSVGTGTASDRVHYDQNPHDPTGGAPLKVLINGYSASASEIVAAALQHHGRAEIIGRQSFGKGSVQNIVPLQQIRGLLRITSSLYFTPSGASIQGRGVTPNVRYVPPAGQKIDPTRKESKLPGTIKNPNTGQLNVRTTSECVAKTNVSMTLPPRQILRGGKPDYHLRCAIESLTGKRKLTTHKAIKVSPHP